MLHVSLYGIHPGKNYGQYICVEAVMRNFMNCFMDNQNIEVLITLTFETYQLIPGILCQPVAYMYYEFQTL